MTSVDTNSQVCSFVTFYVSACPFDGLEVFFELSVLQCFDTVGSVTGRAAGLSKTAWWVAGVVICLERGAGLHIAQLMPLPLTVSFFSEIQIGFTFLVLVAACCMEVRPGL